MKMMKNRLLLPLLLAVIGMTLTGCEDDVRVDRKIKNIFRDQYPHATRAEWEFEQGYYVAEFWLNQAEAKAWYTPQGVWQMTETDARYADLPQAVKNAFERSEYADWRIDDIDRYLTPTSEYYRFELESGNRETMLKIDADGNM